MPYIENGERKIMPVLDYLSDERIFKCNLDQCDNLLEITEACDEHFFVYLNKIQLKGLILELEIIYNRMR